MDSPQHQCWEHPPGMLWDCKRYSWHVCNTSSGTEKIQKTIFIILYTLMVINKNYEWFLAQLSVAAFSLFFEKWNLCKSNHTSDKKLSEQQEFNVLVPQKLFVLMKQKGCSGTNLIFYGSEEECGCGSVQCFQWWWSGRFALLALCEGNTPVTGGFPSQRASN